MMRAVWRRRALSALLAAGVATAGLPGVGRAADEPDLKLEEVHLFTDASGQVSDRVVSFKVTNVGNRDALNWTGRLEILGPPPVPVLGDPFTVAKLDRNGGVFQGRLPLPAPCDGHVVKLWVQAPGETNFADNTVDGLKLCPNKPAPAPAAEDEGSIDYGGCAVCDIPVHLRDGMHADSGPLPAVVLEPSVVRQHGLRHTSTGILGSLDCPFALGSISSEPVPNVGFFHADFSGCDINEVAQLILNFDLQWLRDLRNNVTRAELLFDERVTLAENNNGAPISVATCIGRLGLAPPNWPEIVTRRDSPDSLKPTLLATANADGEWLTSPSGATIGWVATQNVRYASAGHNPPLTGFVLHGLDENLNAEDERACVSAVSNVRLKIEYEVFR